MRPLDRIRQLSEWWNHRQPYEKVSIGIQVVIAGATIVYVFVASLQWGTMISANNLNRRALISVQRAFVTWNGFTLRKFFRTTKSGKQYFIETDNNWLNAGNTPAVGVVNYFRIADQMLNEPDGKDWIPDKSVVRPVTYIGTKATIGVNLDEPISFYVGDKPFSITIEGDKHIYFWGWVVYRDIFPETPPHLTETCQHLIGVAVNEPVGKLITFPITDWSGFDISLNHQGCGRHNCTDADCPEYSALIKLAEMAAEPTATPTVSLRRTPSELLPPTPLGEPSKHPSDAR